MGLNWWRLDEQKNPILVGSVEEMLAWGKKEDFWARVAETRVGEFWVSTVFLGLDHSWDDEGPPVLFETIVFHGKDTVNERRYGSWDGAVDGHRELVLWVGRNKWRLRVTRWWQKVKDAWRRSGGFWGGR